MATIRQIRNLERNFGGPTKSGWLPPEAASPKVQRTVLNLRIDVEKDGYYLVSESSHPHFSGGDTWHRTPEEALHQAELEFKVKPSDWEIVT
jgi:hypothetical protein